MRLRQLWPSRRPRTSHRTGIGDRHCDGHRYRRRRRRVISRWDGVALGPEDLVRSLYGEMEHDHRINGSQPDGHRPRTTAGNTSHSSVTNGLQRYYTTDRERDRTRDQSTVSRSGRSLATATANFGVAGLAFQVDVVALHGAIITPLLTPVRAGTLPPRAQRAQHPGCRRVASAAGNTAQSSVTVTVFNYTTAPFRER